MPFLEVRDLRVHFPVPKGSLKAVDGVNLSVEAGTTRALVGESGCGKSTLARALVGVEKLTNGEVYLKGRKVRGVGARDLPNRLELAAEMQLVFQNPDASLNPRMTLASALAEPLLLHEQVKKSEVEVAVCELLTRVGIDPTLRSRYPHELSGGQRQRVSIARALAVRPSLLILDEAVSALDVSIQAQILQLLTDLQKEFELTYLFITHDLAVVRQIADTVSVMYLGQVVEEGPRDVVLDNPRHPYTQALLASVPTLIPKRRRAVPLSGEVPSPVSPPSGCRFHTRCPQAFDKCASRAPEVIQADSALVRCHLLAPAED